MERARYLIGILTLALAIAGGVVLVNLLGDEDTDQYFRLQVELRNVEGLLPGADVKYRGVQVGTVRRVTLREDGKKGIAIIALNPGREVLACTNSKFWIVTPRFGGITTGASGLETLVRDAYVSFITPDPAGPQLAYGSSVSGWEEPFIDPNETRLAAPRRGDLLMTLLLPENHGLTAGSAVRFRGMDTGEVRRVELAADGSHVRVQLRIDLQHRRTVTERTTFWVARPRLSGGLVGGMSLEDVSALVTPFVSYHSEEETGLPVSDGHVVAAEVQRPQLTLDKVAVTAVEVDPGTTDPVPAIADSVQLVQVIYEALEDDWLSADDEIRREGTGLLYEAGDGRLLVLTARSLCDAQYFDRDTFGGDADIVREGISVVLVDGTPLHALRTWAPEEGDLVVLTVDQDNGGGSRDRVAISSGDRMDFDQAALPDGTLQLRHLDAERNTVERALAAGDPRPLPSATEHRGTLVLSGERAIGVLGQRTGIDEEPAITLLSVVPESLRPRP